MFLSNIPTYRVRPKFVVIDLGNAYSNFKSMVQAKRFDVLEFTHSTVKDLVDYISSKLDAPINLIESALDLAQQDEELSEEIFELGNRVYSEFLRNGLYETDGACVYEFKKFLDGTSILLEYDEHAREAFGLSHNATLEVVTDKMVKDHSLPSTEEKFVLLGRF